MPKLIDADIVKVLRTPEPRGEVLATLFWGDAVLDAVPAGKYTKVTLDQGRVGYVQGRLELRVDPLLRVCYIDVGQGDATLIETPDGHRLLIDAGEDKFVARYLAAKYAAHQGPVHFDAIVITHGDADHFYGMPILVDAADGDKKRVVVTASRVFHNGLAKRRLQDGKRTFAAFGRSVPLPQGQLITELVDDPHRVPRSQRTAFYQRWIDSLDVLRKRGGHRGRFQVMRLDASQLRAFSFLGPQVQMEVLGPVLQRAGRTVGLPFLRGEGGRGWSASHTVNGHSIVLRLVHGDVRFLFSGDLNAEAEDMLLRQAGTPEFFRAEVLKVPHHGSADFGDAFLRAVAPIVSVISTGATDVRRDYLHPRATMLAALGAASRAPVMPPRKKGGSVRPAEPILFVTRLAGALRFMGQAIQVHVGEDGQCVPKVATKPFYALERSNYGIVHFRSDGKRFLVARHGSGLEKKEAYAYRSVGNSQFVGDTVRRR